MVRYDGRGGIDGPADGSRVVAGPVVVSGWAVLGRRAATSVVLHVDGRHAAAGATGLDRPDVAEVLSQDELTDAGWAIVLDLSDRAPGPVTLSAIAVDAGGAAEVGRVRLEVVPAPPVVPPRLILGSVDLPLDGSTVPPGPVVVHGWALVGDDLPARVEVLVDGEVASVARIGDPRPDVASVHPGPSSAVCGYLTEVHLPGGTVEVEVVVVAGDGERGSLGTRTVTVGPGAPEVGA